MRKASAKNLVFESTYTEGEALVFGGGGGPAESGGGEKSNADAHRRERRLFMHVQQIQLRVVVGLDAKPH